jgi:hypothetical protein
MAALARECLVALIHYLENILRYLDKAAQFAKEQNDDIETYLTEKLVPDQYDLLHQAQYAYFTALEIGERISGIKPPEFTYDEKTLAELRECIYRTIDYLKPLMDRTEMIDIEKQVETYLVERPMPLSEYLFRFGMPNFFFHTTLAYEILRRKGVSLGKDDFIGI